MDTRKERYFWVNRSGNSVSTFGGKTGTGKVPETSIPAAEFPDPEIRLPAVQVKILVPVPLTGILRYAFPIQFHPERSGIVCRAGYMAVNYSNQDYLKNMFDDCLLSYPLWYARYNRVAVHPEISFLPRIHMQKTIIHPDSVYTNSGWNWMGKA